jgi:acyl-phosphate glycerol 3-phosphate acyltransferase
MFSQKHAYRLDSNREFLALAGANLAAGLGQGFPVSGGMSQSLVNESGGARTPLSGLFASAVVLLVALFLSGTLRNLPQPVLAAIVLLAVTGLAAFVGHVFPVWLRFHGGKGVATAAGVLIALDWRMGLSVVALWIVVAAASRYSSLAALVAAVVAPIAAWYLFGMGAVFAAVAVMSVVLVARHHANIRKLLRGEESRIGEKKQPPTESVTP